MQALINMLEAADALLENGDTAEACAQLWDAYHKVDGDPRPPDFVAGPAAPELAAMLLELITDLARG